MLLPRRGFRRRLSAPSHGGRNYEACADDCVENAARTRST